MHSANISLKPITIFTACAGDCSVERQIVTEVARDLENVANFQGLTLRVKNWTQVVPNAGRPQQVIFDQIPTETWDVLVCTMWLRFGSKSGGINSITGDYVESGTEEEFALALDTWKKTGRPRILFYRRTAGPPDISTVDINQLRLVNEFFAKFGPGQPYEALYKAYMSHDDFRLEFRNHLQELLIHAKTESSTHPKGEIAEQELLPKEVFEGWREYLIRTYDKLKLHRISSAYDAGSILKADRDRVHLHDVFIPQNVCDVTDFVAERLPFPKVLASSTSAELRILGLVNWQGIKRSKRRPVLDVLKNNKEKHTVFLGHPGAGKSSLLHYYALAWAKNSASPNILPLLVEMRQYAARIFRAKEEKDVQPSILEWAGEVLGGVIGSAPISDKLLIKALENGKLILLCDALDEIFDSISRKDAAEQILRLAIKCPSGQIIVTSRPVGYPDDVLGPVGFGHWLIQDFDKTQIKRFVQLWIASSLPDIEDQANVKNRMSSALEIRRVKEMAGNPLLLTLMSILARTDELPRDRVRLFAKAAELLLYQWDTSRSLRPVHGLDFAYEQKHRVLRELAWRMQNAQIGLSGNIAPIEMVREVFDNELASDLDRPGDRARGVALLLETLRVRDHVICHLGGDKFAFVHRGFLEYFCADWMCEKIRRSPSTAEQELFELFNANSTSPQWEEVFTLGALAISPEVVDSILCKIDNVLTKRGELVRWISGCVFAGTKTRSRYPKAVSYIRQKIINEVCPPNNKFPIATLIGELARFWHDEEIRSIVTNVLITASSPPKARRTAGAILAEHWMDDISRGHILEVVKTANGRVGRSLLARLVQHWHDDEVRVLTSKIACGDPETQLASVALHHLVLWWPDEQTREILVQISELHPLTLAGKSALLHLQSKVYSSGETNPYRTTPISNSIDEQANKNTSDTQCESGGEGGN